MLDGLRDWLFSPSGLTAHGFCLLWEPWLIWTHALADIVIGIAYFTIPWALAVFAQRRQDLAFKPVFWLFAAFILLCGTGHWLDLLTLWVPAYKLQGSVKIATAVVSLITALALWPLLPKALSLPSPAQLREANRTLELVAEERRIAAEALSESERRHRALFTHAPVPLYSLDLEGRLHSVSDRWLELLGYANRDEVLGHYLAEFMTEEGAHQFRLVWPVFLADGTLNDLASSFVTRAGDVVHVLISACLLMDEAGMPTRTMGSLVDITKRKRAEDALRASEERLHQAQKMEAVGQLTGGVAHDFNNVLMAIVGNLELIRSRIPEEYGEVTRLASNALDAAGKAAGLTAQLLSFSRRQRLDPRPLDPVDVVQGLYALLTRTAGDRISLKFEADRDIGLCLADRNQLESAVLNLIINARDAIDGGGSITVKLRTTRIVATPDGWPPEGDYIRIAVSDDGPGMPEEVRCRAFEPFFTTKGPGKGTGLGLAQIHGFAHQSGGTATIDSAPGQGTEVAILLPRTYSTPRPLEASRGGSTEDGRGCGQAVLLVEDDPLVRGSLATTLVDAGFCVMEAEDADIALAALDHGAVVDIILTDLTMPGSMDGVELAHAARARRPGLPIVLATGHLDPLRERRLPDGMGFVQKPCNRAQLTEALRKALDTVADVVPG